jgi:hypothetical protein
VLRVGEGCSAAFNPLNVSNQQLNHLETYKTTRRKYYDCYGIAGGKKGEKIKR